MLRKFLVVQQSEDIAKPKGIAYKDCNNFKSFGKKIGESVKVQIRKIKAVLR